MRWILLILMLPLGACAPYSGEQEQLTFVSRDGTHLAGSLVMPNHAEAPYPAVVMLHGAEAATRSFAYRMQANVFLERGFAVLLYDKRGAGESAGEYRAPFRLLIEDALAALERLRIDPRIDAGAIGIMSTSESGWFAPEIAARSPTLRFAVNKAGPAVSWRETVGWETYHELLADGLSEQQARVEADLRMRIWQYQADPDPADLPGLRAELARQSKDDQALQPVDAERRARISYDPAPFLDELRVPMLYVYGGADVNVPTEQCVARLRELQASGKPVAFHVYEDAGHELAAISLLPPFYRFEPGFAELIGDFAAAQLRARR